MNKPRNKKNGAPVLAVDIGGTKMLAALFGAGGKMLDKTTGPTLAQEGVEPVIGRLTAAIDAVLENNKVQSSRLAGICIACAGGIDTGRGVVVTPSPNLPGWVNVPLADILHGKYQVPAYIINDASAAALGEHRYGAGVGVRDLVLLTLGTGIGGGIVADGKLYLGAVGAAGELGHMTVEAGGPACGCGNKGCLEMLASGKAIARDAVRRVREGLKKSILTEMAAGKLENITAEMVGAAARRDDLLSKDVIAQAAYYLGVGLVNIVNIFNPEMIVLGGGMAGLGDLLIGPARRMTAERAFSVSSQAARIVTAQLGNEAGVYGGAAFAFDKVQGGYYEST